MAPQISFDYTQYLQTLSPTNFTSSQRFHCEQSEVSGFIIRPPIAFLSLPHWRRLSPCARRRSPVPATPTFMCSRRGQIEDPKASLRQWIRISVPPPPLPIELNRLRSREMARGKLYDD